MTANEWGLLVGVAFALGGVAGSWLTLGVLGARHATALRRMSDDFQRQSDAVVGQFRAAQLRSQTEIEMLRQASQRDIATAGDAPREAAARAEVRLRLANAEIDRLRRTAAPETTIRADLSDGFADTRPMVEGM